MSIVPVARSMYLCDDFRRQSNGTVDLFGIFNALEPNGGFPFVRSQICVYAQLTDGIGDYALQVDIRFANTGKLVFSSAVHKISLDDRNAVVQVVVRLSDCQFARRGRYLFELFCDNIWISDTYLQLE